MKKESSKLPIILGIVILIVILGLIGMGYYFSSKTPDKIFESALNELAQKMITKIEEEEDFNLTEHDIKIEGNLKFDTNYNLNGLEALKDFTYEFQEEMSWAQQIFKINLAMKEEEKETISLKAFLQDGNSYLDIPGILPTTLDLGENSLEDEINLEEMTFDKEDYKIIIQETKNMLIQTLDKTKISTNKNIQKEYDGESINTTEYIYLLDEENQERTLNEIKEKVLSNEEYIRSLANIMGKDESEIRDEIENSKESSFEQDIKIVVTTTSITNNPIALDIIEEDNQISYNSYNDKTILKINDFEIEWQEGEILIHVDSEDYQGTITLKTTKQSDSLYDINIKMDGKYSNIDINLLINAKIDLNAEITKEDVSTAKKEEDFSEQEQSEIIQNFLNKIEGTSLEKLIGGYIFDIL